MQVTSAIMAEEYPDNEVRIVRKSNEFINAKYKNTLLENQIVAISLTKLQITSTNIRAVISPGEIKMLLGRQSDTNLYKKLKKAAHNLHGNIITIEDREKRNFHTFALVTNVDYEDGQFCITYNEKMRPYISDFQKGSFTSMELAILVNFERNSSLRLYELLKKEAYQIKHGAKYISKSYGINELKASIGLIKTDAGYIREAVDKGYSWDYIVENVCKPEDKTYDNWTDLRRRVIIPAQDEMKQKADIRFEYDVIRGNTAKVTGVRFIIFPNMPEVKQESKIEATTGVIEKAAPDFNVIEYQEEYEEIKQYLLDHGIKKLSGFTSTYFRKLFIDANYDVNIIKEEIDYSLKEPVIRNFFGWLRTAVRERYSQVEEVAVENGSTEDADLAKEMHESIHQPITSEPDGRPAQDDFRVSIWNKYKEKDDFPEFLAYYHANNADELEIAFSVDDLIAMFVDYKKNIQTR